jgi:O-acetyl-ADP-ribose deacetylase
MIPYHKGFLCILSGLALIYIFNKQWAIIMEISINNAILVLAEGDITTEETDVIVNAANASLIPGGGVDGAIHRAGGPAIAAACRLIGSCPVGQAVATTAGRLKAKFVIHTVGPRYRDGKHSEAELLQSAYLSSLKLAAEMGLKSISFPAISAGVYGYPLDEAARIALATAIGYLQAHQLPCPVRFILFNHLIYDAFAEQLRKLIN